MTHQIGFKHAISGIKYSFTSQPNFRFHSLMAIISLLLGKFLGINKTEWLILIFTILLVFIAEMLNTSVEAMTDLIEEKHNQKAKIAKDVSAGMVLLTSIASVIIGLIIFLPKFINLNS